MTSTELATHPRALRRGLAAAPALLLALLPKVACPACWPAYGSSLSALGLGSAMDSPWRAPLLGAFLLPALWLLARAARRRHDRRPLVVGSVGAGMCLLATVYDQAAASLLGSALFVTAMVWSSFAPRSPRHGSLCVPTQPDGGASAARCCRRA